MALLWNSKLESWSGGIFVMWSNCWCYSVLSYEIEPNPSNLGKVMAIFAIFVFCNICCHSFAFWSWNALIHVKRKEEDRRQAEQSGCAVDTRHRPLSPPLRTPEREDRTVNCSILCLHCTLRMNHIMTVLHFISLLQPCRIWSCFHVNLIWNFSK